MERQIECEWKSVGSNTILGGIIGLPLEILIEVFKELPWRDILRVRQTCRHLRIVTQTKAIWQNVLNDHIPRLALPCSPLVKPIGSYTARELELLVLRWKSVEMAWDASSCRLPRERTILVNKPVRALHVLTGGRWVLFAHPSGEVSYCDLETEEFVLIPLVPPASKDGSSMVTYMSVDEARESQLLSFNIAMSTRPLDPHSHKSGTTRIDVWHVTLLLNDCHDAAGFHPKRISSFPVRVRARIVSISISGRWLACEMDLVDIMRQQVLIIDWTRANGESAQFLRRTLTIRYDRLTSLRLLPRNKILLGTSKHICILDFSTIPETTGQSSIADLFTIPSPIWEMNLLPLSFVRFSPVFISSGHTYIVFRTRTAVLGLSIMDNTDSSPNFDVQVTTLLTHPRESFGVLEYSQNFSFRYGVSWTTSSKIPCLVILRSPWPDYNGGPPNGTRLVPLSYTEAPSSGIHIDPLSGRVIFLGFKHELIISEFALV